MSGNKWIISRPFDILWFILPQLLPALIILFLPDTFLNRQRTEIFPISWVLIVLAIDVTHVYSTVYKTYFKEEGWRKYQLKLKFLPFGVWFGGIIIYTISSNLFWSCLAYFAVYHFVRQQYGFFRLYTKHPITSKVRSRIMHLTIYAATVVPVLIWHLKGAQNFYWMLKGDFKYFNFPALVPYVQVLYILLMCVYLYCEYQEKRTCQQWNWGRILLTLSTAFAWYACIVSINNDFTFSLVNVIGHGIPYLALVWITEKKALQQESSDFFKYLFSKWGWMLFYVIIFAFAYLEEGIWDTLVWNEHGETFGWMHFTSVIEDYQILSFVVPLLIMPQVVHYILDAYIWKREG